MSTVTPPEMERRMASVGEIPCAVHELLAGEHLPGVGHQEHQQVELLAGKVGFLTVDRDHSGLQTDGQPVEPQGATDSGG